MLITTGYVVGNNTGSGASPQGVSLGSMIDTIGNTQGQILYRGSGAGNWTTLATGTLHQVLESGGRLGQRGLDGHTDTEHPDHKRGHKPGTVRCEYDGWKQRAGRFSFDQRTGLGPDLHLSGQAKATQKSAIFDYYQGTTGNSYNDSSLAIGFFGETPTNDFNLKKGGNLTLGSAGSGGLTVNGDVTATAAQVTAGSGTGFTVNQSGDVRQLVYKATVTYLGLSAAAKTADVTVCTLPAKCKVTSIYVDVTTPFKGGGETAATMTVGPCRWKQWYGVVVRRVHGCGHEGLGRRGLGDGHQPGKRSPRGLPPVVERHDAGFPRLTTTTNNTSSLTQGSVTFYVATELYP